MTETSRKSITPTACSAAIQLTCFLGSGMPLRSRSVRCCCAGDGGGSAPAAKATGGDDRRCGWCGAVDRGAGRCSEPPCADGPGAAGISVFSSRRIVFAHSLVSRMLAETAVVGGAGAAAAAALLPLLLGDTSGDEVVDEDVEPGSDEPDGRRLEWWAGAVDVRPYAGGWFCCLYCSKTSLISRCNSAEQTEMKSNVSLFRVGTTVTSALYSCKHILACSCAACSVCGRCTRSCYCCAGFSELRHNRRHNSSHCAKLVSPELEFSSLRRNHRTSAQSRHASRSARTAHMRARARASTSHMPCV